MNNDSKNQKLPFDIDDSKKLSDNFSKVFNNLFPVSPERLTPKIFPQYSTNKKDYYKNNNSNTKSFCYSGNNLSEIFLGQNQFLNFSDEKNPYNYFNEQNDFQISGKKRLNNKLNNDFEKEFTFNQKTDEQENKNFNIIINNEFFNLIKYAYNFMNECTIDSSLSDIKNIKKIEKNIDIKENGNDNICMCKKTRCCRKYCSCKKNKKKCNEKCGCIHCNNKKCNKNK